jgi:hypothetical protein
MPFPCINITDLSHSCSKLLTYCNNNYAVEVDWCNCFNNNYNNKCDAVALPISGIVLIAIGGAIAVLGMITVIVVLYKHYHDTKNPNQNNRNNRDDNNTNTNELENYYPNSLVPVNTNIRSNAITNLQPMVIIPIESTSDLPKYENPPEYEKKTTNC